VMRRTHDTPNGPPSPYDPDPEREGEDAWFLPADTPDAEDPAAMPLPRADRRHLLDPASWRAAEASLAPDLARVAARFGALDERLRHAAEGQKQRLALIEASEFGWQAGDRVSPDRLALWLGMRLEGPRDDTQALMRAGWATRRLTGGPGPDAGMAAFLGRRDDEVDQDWAEMAEAGPGLHPITRAAMVLHGWQALAGNGTAARIEAAVIAARLAAADGLGGAVFLPLATGGSAALRPGGDVSARLARWYAGAGQATMLALRLLERLETWRIRANGATQELSGRTPPMLIAALARWPMVSAALAEAETGASRAAVQRNLDRLVALGLIREVTGQGRFRLWAAQT
jgi:hypothetical protein